MFWRRHRPEPDNDTEPEIDAAQVARDARDLARQFEQAFQRIEPALRRLDVPEGHAGD